MFSFKVKILYEEHVRKTLMKLTPEQYVSVLLEMRCNPNVGDRNWKTGVHYAAENEHLKILEVLDDFQADFSATTIKGETAIHLAARKGIKIGQSVDSTLKFNSKV